MGKNELSKVYIALFTCSLTRAVHLEIVEDLTSHSFIRCFQRYCSRKGIPKLVVSNNAKTFKNAQKILVALFEMPEVREHFTKLRIRWQYILAKAPWWGGFMNVLFEMSKQP